MCQFYLNKQKRLCANKAEPYCYIHRKIEPILPIPPLQREQYVPPMCEEVVVHKEEPCCICYEEDDIIVTPCKHHICEMCTIFLVGNGCPICRTNISASFPQKIKSIREHFDVKNDRIKNLENQVRTLEYEVRNRAAIDDTAAVMMRILNIRT